jgi:hypothetical protein
MTKKTAVLSYVAISKLVMTDIPNQLCDIKPKKIVNLDKLFVQHLKKILALLLRPFEVDFT